jgi:hypothetical protein
VAQHFSCAAQAFIAKAAIPLRVASGKTCVSKPRQLGSTQFSGICTVSKGKSVRRHFEMNLWILVPGKNDEAPFPAAWQ